MGSVRVLPGFLTGSIESCCRDSTRISSEFCRGSSYEGYGRILELSFTGCRSVLRVIDVRDAQGLGLGVRALDWFRYGFGSVL